MSIKNSLETTNPIEKAIRNRLETGFKNWNGGYEGWLDWCNTLYEPDAHYNIPFGGSQRRCTLEEYKSMMGQLFQHFTMDLGEFENMIIKDNWCAIRYTVKVTNLDTGKEIVQNTMEFVEFKDNGDDRGVRVVEVGLYLILHYPNFKLTNMDFERRCCHYDISFLL